MPIKGSHLRKYSTKEKQDAIDALAKGMGCSEIAKLTGIPIGTIQAWKNKKPSKPLICPVCQQPFLRAQGLGAHLRSHGKQLNTPGQTISTLNKLHEAKMSLDDFCDMMVAALREREQWKTKYHDLEKSVEKWRDMAGKLNEQLQDIKR